MGGEPCALRDLASNNCVGIKVALEKEKPYKGKETTNKNERGGH